MNKYTDNSDSDGERSDRKPQKQADRRSGYDSDRRSRDGSDSSGDRRPYRSM